MPDELILPRARCACQKKCCPAPSQLSGQRIGAQRPSATRGRTSGRARHARYSYLAHGAAPLGTLVKARRYDLPMNTAYGIAVRGGGDDVRSRPPWGVGSRRFIAACSLANAVLGAPAGLGGAELDMG